MVAVAVVIVVFYLSSKSKQQSPYFLQSRSQKHDNFNCLSCFPHRPSHEAEQPSNWLYVTVLFRLRANAFKLDVLPL